MPRAETDRSDGLASLKGRTMHRYLKYGLIENVDTVRRVRLGTFWGVAISATPIAWLNPAIFGGLRLLLGLTRELSLPDRLTDAALFALAVQVATLVHAGGHILGGRLVGSAMDELLITATRDVNRYAGDQTVLPGYVHFGRAFGGPAANLIVYGLCAALLSGLPAGLGHDLGSQIMSVNQFFGLGGFLPLPSVDGAVIWREVWRALRRQLAGKSGDDPAS